MTVAASSARDVWGERSQTGNLIVSLDASLSPHKLPRSRFVPAAVSLHTRFETADGTLIPQLKGLTIDLSSRGKLFTKGLARCPIRRLEPASPKGAMDSCGKALVGLGRLHAIVTLPGQKPFLFKAHLFAFNGEPGKGQGTVLVLVYGPQPPTSFVLPFVIHESGSDLGTKLTTHLPKDAGSWAHLGGFGIVLKRHFTYRGKQRSFIYANCPAPRGFTGGLTPFARGTYHFAGAQSVSTVIVRGCKVAGGGRRARAG